MMHIYGGTRYTGLQNHIRLISIYTIHFFRPSVSYFYILKQNFITLKPNIMNDVIGILFELALVLWSIFVFLFKINLNLFCNANIHFNSFRIWVIIFYYLFIYLLPWFGWPYFLCFVSGVFIFPFSEINGEHSGQILGYLYLSHNLQ